MDLKTFFEHFDTLAEAPNGIQRLRELILDMAVRGKLVPQDPEDEPAGKLVEVNKNQILKSRTGKRKNIPQIGSSDVLLPIGWARCQLADIALVEMGNSPPGSTYNQHGDGVPLINGPVEFTKGSFGLTVVNQYTTAPSRMCRNGDLLVCVRGATTGRTNIAAFDACIGRGVALVRGWEAQNYLNYLMWWFGEKLLKQGKGTTFPSISFTDLGGLEVLIPPLAEQKRIVAKVDELMGLCDRLEAAQQTRNTLRQSLRASALDALMNATSDDALATAWAFVRDRWGMMSDRPEDVAGLRKLTLDTAMRGKLVSQDPEDEPAGILIRKIQERKEELAKIRKIKQAKPLDKIHPDIIPYELPDGWEWIWLDSISDIGTGSTPLKSTAEFYLNGTIPWVTSAATSQTLITKSETLVTELAVKEHRLRTYFPGSLVVALYGQGKTRGQVARLGINATINQACAAITFVESQETLADYIQFFFEKQYDELRALAAGGAQPNLNVRKVKETLIPLPPLAEQKRIVAKVDELMKLCDQLEESLRQQQQHAEALVTSAISHLAA
jgi:type I restriction enzyme S subunit